MLNVNFNRQRPFERTLTGVIAIALAIVYGAACAFGVGYAWAGDVSFVLTLLF